MEKEKIKKCTKCEIEKTFDNFYKEKNNKKYGLTSRCKDCLRIDKKQYRLRNKDKAEERDYIYYNSERGFVITKIKDIFKPSRIKARGWKPECTKEEMLDKFNEYVKEHGRNCFYCGGPWTYITNKHKREEGPSPRKKGSNNYENFSIDRFDSSKTYTLDNIYFVHHKCNDSKKNISLNLIESLYKIIQERKNGS